MTQPSSKLPELWFASGSQHLYGPKTLEAVAGNVRTIAEGLNTSARIPLRIVAKPVLTDAGAILNIVREANNAPDCAGLILWMHTFSPAKMWIAGLKALQKPFLHFHTQFNRDIPWADIDMDFMNLNQSAHGDREFGFMCSRLGKKRKVVVGHWQDETVQDSIAQWSRVALAWNDSQGGKIARFGDNMRDVAVTEGDKIEAQIIFGYTVSGYGVGDLVKRVTSISDDEVTRLVSRYEEEYVLAANARKGGEYHGALREGARIEIGLRSFLEEGGFTGFTTTFEDLHGLKQLPGLAVQRLMADGYGFGAEGDWKTSALIRAMKVMSAGFTGGTSFMEDYTYHMNPQGKLVLGAHMLEVCPSIGTGKPSLEIHPLGIGGKEPPPRLVFNVATGPALNATILDMGHRFRLLINEVEVVTPTQLLPKLPVARAVWKPKPDFETAAASWILAGGAHHTSFSQAVTTSMLQEFADMANIECIVIDGSTTVTHFQKELRWNEAAFSSTRG